MLRSHDGTALTGRTFTWWSRDIQIATVSADGLVTGLATGEAYVTATAQPDGLSAFITLNVTPGPPASVVVTPPSISVRRGERKALQGAVVDAFGNPTERSLSWSSSNPAVATVGADGIVSGVTVGGPVTITASAVGLSGEATVIVTPGVDMSVQMMSAGFYHSCALTRNGQAYCWGDISLGAAGSFTTIEQGNRVLGHLASGDLSACALTSSGQMFCWGTGGYGADVNVGGLVFAHIAGRAPRWAATSHGCGLTAAGRAYCWGPSDHGQLGIGDPIGPAPRRDVPFAVDQGQLSFTDITVGGQFTCALSTEGQAYCWGDNTYGQLGDSTTAPRSTPSRVHQGSLEFVSITAGNIHVCALTSNGRAYCWGDNVSGQSGDAPLTRRIVPSAAHQSWIPFKSMAAGFLHSCAISTGNRAFCWGSNRFGQLGNRTSVYDPTPVLVEGDLLFAGITANRSHTCAWTGAGRAYCWGENDYGQVGDGTMTNQFVPTAVKVP